MEEVLPYKFGPILGQIFKKVQVVARLIFCKFGRRGIERPVKDWRMQSKFCPKNSVLATAE